MEVIAFSVGGLWLGIESERVAKWFKPSKLEVTDRTGQWLVDLRAALTGVVDTCARFSVSPRADPVGGTVLVVSAGGKAVPLLLAPGCAVRELKDVEMEDPGPECSLEADQVRGIVRSEMGTVIVPDWDRVLTSEEPVQLKPPGPEAIDERQLARALGKLVAGGGRPDLDEVRQLAKRFGLPLTRAAAFLSYYTALERAEERPGERVRSEAADRE